MAATGESPGVVERPVDVAEGRFRHRGCKVRLGVGRLPLEHEVIGISSPRVNQNVDAVADVIV